MNDADLGFAAPGHAEESDYMRAFFENQDHQAVSIVYSYYGVYCR